MMKNILSVMNSLIIITGFILMIGSAGALDYSVEIGSIEDPSGDYRRMILGVIFLIIGFSYAYWRQNRDERETFRKSDQEIHREFRRLAG